MDGQKQHARWLLAAVLYGICTAAASAQAPLPPPSAAEPAANSNEPPADSNEPPENIRAPVEAPLELIEFNDLPMSEAARLLSDQTGLKIVPTTEAAKVSISIYLRQVTAKVALDALTKANGLFYRQDPNSEIIRIYTIEEYESDLGSFREEETEVFTLLYPNPVDVAVAIRDVFGADRVRMTLGIGEMMMYQDLIQRFIRYRLVSSQNQQGTISTGGGGGGIG
ncbi:MAG TPA: hypothetical protein VIK18_12910, partial [Pirellulales bacterium]